MNLGVDSTAVNGDFTAGAVSVLTLHTARCNAFYLNGTVSLTFQGGVHVNSRATQNVSPCTNSQAAAIGKGNSSVIRLVGTSRMRVRGSWKDLNIQPTPDKGGVLADPYIGLAEPSDSASPFTHVLNPRIDEKKETRCTDVPYQSPIYGPFDADGNGTIEPAFDYNGDGVIARYDWDGDNGFGEALAGVDWDAGIRPTLSVPPLDAALVLYLNTLTVVNGNITNTIDGNPPPGVTFGDGVIDFYETEFNDDLNGDGAIDQGIIGYETLYRRVCNDIYAWIMSPGRYTSQQVMDRVSPSSGNYLVFTPGVYVFEGVTVRNSGGVMCTLPADNPNPGGWNYQDVKASCDSSSAWQAVCPSLHDQRLGATRCGALLHWSRFTTCGRSNPPELLSAGGNGETLLRPYLSGASEGTDLERYDGFLLWFDRDHAAEPGCNATLRGGGASMFSGTIYGPTTNMKMSGGGTGTAGAVTLQMVVQTVEFKGGSIFTFEYDEDELSRYFVYGLVE